MEGHGIPAEGAVEILEVVEVAEKMEQGNIDNAQGKILSGPRALATLEIQEEERQAEKSKGHSGKERKAARIRDASGVECAGEEKIFERKINASAKLDNGSHTDEDYDQRQDSSEAGSSGCARRAKHK